MPKDRAATEQTPALRDLVSRGSRALRENGVEAPRLAAELLMAQVLGKDRIHYLSHGGEPAGAGVAAAYEGLILRCARGEPLQYLTGEREFYGLSFRVTPAVLIPRPETELLVEKALALASAGAGLRWVDVGTGSGCIAVSVARSLPGARVWAVDLSCEALEVARLNAARHRVEGRICFVCADLLSCFPRQPTFDFVLANLPYIPAADLPALPAAVRDFEPAMALAGGESGMHHYQRLVPQCAACLAAGGHLLLELGQGQADCGKALAEAAGLRVLECAADLQGIPRCLVARKESEVAEHG